MEPAPEFTIRITGIDIEAATIPTHRRPLRGGMHANELTYPFNLSEDAPREWIDVLVTRWIHRGREERLAIDGCVLRLTSSLSKLTPLFDQLKEVVGEANVAYRAHLAQEAQEAVLEAAQREELRQVASKLQF
jgi:hypothetical protein